MAKNTFELSTEALQRFTDRLIIGGLDNLPCSLEAAELMAQSILKPLEMHEVDAEDIKFSVNANLSKVMRELKSEEVGGMPLHAYHTKLVELYAYELVLFKLDAEFI